MTIEEIKSKYENGRIPLNKLKKVEEGQYLVKKAGESYLRMKADAKKDGIIFELPYATSTYRPCGDEGDYRNGQCKDGLFTQWCAWEKYKAGAGNLASNPTTSRGCTSNHGWGLAIDVKPTKAQNWIKQNGEKYGWWWSGGTFGQIENWHFDYDEKRDTFRSKKGGKIVLYSFIGLSLIGIGLGLYFATRKK